MPLEYLNVVLQAPTPDNQERSAQIDLRPQSTYDRVLMEDPEAPRGRTNS